MTIDEKQRELIDNLNFLEEWDEKYEYIIDYSKKIPIIEDKYKTDEYLVQGCQSRLWLQAVSNNGNIIYRADSDADIPKGLASMLIEVYSDSSADEILKTNLTFLKDTGIIFHLSPNRVKGLNSLIGKMKEYANKLKKHEE